MDLNIKNYGGIRKLTTGEGENYTTSCLLNYDNIKLYFELTEIDLSGKDKLNADPEANRIRWTLITA